MYIVANIDNDNNVNNIIYKQIQDDMQKEICEVEVDIETRKNKGIEDIKSEFEMNKNKITKRDDLGNNNVSKDILDTFKKRFANLKGSNKSVQLK
jgi:hypothetical protein